MNRCWVQVREEHFCFISIIGSLLTRLADLTSLLPSQTLLLNNTSTIAYIGRRLFLNL